MWYCRFSGKQQLPAFAEKNSNWIQCIDQPKRTHRNGLFGRSCHGQLLAYSSVHKEDGHETQKCALRWGLRKSRAVLKCNAWELFRGKVGEQSLALKKQTCWWIQIMVTTSIWVPSLENLKRLNFGFPTLQMTSCTMKHPIAPSRINHKNEKWKRSWYLDWIILSTPWKRITCHP